MWGVVAGACSVACKIRCASDENGNGNVKFQLVVTAHSLFIYEFKRELVLLFTKAERSSVGSHWKCNIIRLTNSPPIHQGRSFHDWFFVPKSFWHN